MNSIKCVYKNKRRYVQLVSESLDDDTWDRSIMPVFITTEGEDADWTQAGYFNNTLNSFASHKLDGYYKTAQKRLSRFPGIIETERAYNVTYTGTVPTLMKYQL